MIKDLEIRIAFKYVDGTSIEIGASITCNGADVAEERAVKLTRILCHSPDFKRLVAA
jgi:hypothetical protein